MWQELGVDFVPDLVLMLKYGKSSHQREALRVLAQIGPSAQSAIPDIIKTLKDPDDDTRKLAAEALKQIGSNAGTGVAGN